MIRGNDLLAFFHTELNMLMKWDFHSDGLEQQGCTIEAAYNAET